MRFFLCILCVLTVALCAAPAFAGIVYSPTGCNPASGWTSATNGYIGYQSDGSITVTPTGTLSSSYGYIGGSTSSYPTVHGTASFTGGTTAGRWLNTNTISVGYYGIGEMDLYTAGYVSDTIGYIGDKSGSTGTVNVDGMYSTSSSTWTNSGSGTNALYVGNSGNGTLNVTNGGVVADGANKAYIGNNLGSTGLFTLDGVNGTKPSQLTSTQALYVGYNGGGTLKITNGATVSDSLGYIGGYSASSTGTGAVTVDGFTGTYFSTWTNSGSLTVGGNGTGSLTISNGGIVKSNSSYTYIGYYNSGNGTLTVNTGGALTTSKAFIGGYGTYAGTGTAWVDGAASSWTISNNDLNVGVNNAGTLKITNNANVTTGTGSTYVGYGSPTTWTGKIDFGAAGGTLTTKSLLAGASQLTGTGTINTNGLVSDTTLNFATAADLTKTLTVGGATVNLSQTAGTFGYLGAGYIGNGSLTIQSGLTVSSNTGYLGYYAGSVGTATVSGAGSTWATGSGGAVIGNSGAGSLTISGGGTFATGGGSGNITIGNNATGNGTFTIDGAGSTANCWWCYVGLSGTGTLKITNGGALASNGYTQMGSNAGASGTATVDGAGSTWTVANTWYLGDYGNGTVNITNGGAVTSSQAYLGFWGSAGGKGKVFVDGSGSKWTTTDLYVDAAAGTLKITNGGTVYNTGVGSVGYINDVAGTAVASIDGTGSNWTNTASGIGVGYGGTGIGQVYVSGGGNLTAPGVSVASTSLLQVDVGRGSSISVAGGAGTLTNSGTVRIVCGASPAPASTATPIAASWAGAGTVQAVGGAWNSGTGTFTASNILPGAAGTNVSIDTSTQQRMLITDSGSGKALGASFLATSGPLTVGLTASTAAGPAHTLAAWTFSAVSGYTAGDPAYLSVSLGGAPYGYYADSKPSVWSYDGSTWSAYAANDFTRDGTYGSFTVTALATSGAGTGYAITGIAIIAGDANLDKTIDVGDLGIVLNNYDRTTAMSWATGDFNGDGTVDLSDLSSVLNNYNATAASGGIHAVPEPGTLTLLAAALVALMALVRRARK